MLQLRHPSKITKLFYRIALVTVPLIVVLFTFLQVNSRIRNGDIDLIFRSSFGLIFSTLLFLSFLNWLLEAWKWKVMMSGIRTSSWREAYCSVLAGISLGFITPGRIGDYFGKNWYTEKNKRASGIYTAVLSGIIQTIITFSAGMISLSLLYASGTDSFQLNFSDALVFIFILTGVLITALVFFPSYIFSPLLRIPLFKGQAENALIAFRQFSYLRILYFFKISLLRHGVFSLQFLIILLLFGVKEQPFILLQKISVVYLFSAFIPSFFLGKFGIREAFAVIIIGMPMGQNIEVVSASLLIWLINQALPALLGSVVMITAKPKPVS